MSALWASSVRFFSRSQRGLRGQQSFKWTRESESDLRIRDERKTNDEEQSGDELNCNGKSPSFVETSLASPVRNCIPHP
jgi:hypothetical protein